MNVFAMIPPKARLVLYVAYGVGSVVVTYLAAKSYIGVEEVALWTGLGVPLGITAASNVDLSHPVDDTEDERYVPEHRAG